MESVRKLMGWCPQKENEFFQEQTIGLMHASSLNLNPCCKSNESIEQMDVPLYFFDWRTAAILIVLFISFFISSITAHVYGTPLSYLATTLIMVTSFVLLFVSYHYRVSINSEGLLIKTPLLSSIKIPKKKIEGVKNIENIIYKQKHNWVNIVHILSILVITLLLVMNLYVHISRSRVLEDSVISAITSIFLVSIYIILFYRHSHCSHYPRAIQIESGNKKITICPRNESEFNFLKEELER
jgi:hypothetical protein